MSLLSANLASLYARHPDLRSLALEEAGEGPLAVEQAACTRGTTRRGRRAASWIGSCPPGSARRSSSASAWATCPRPSCGCIPEGPWW
jgi:hypothetical protein